MAEPDWLGAEDLLLARSQAIIRRFDQEHPGEAVSFFFFTVDVEFTGVGLNFDTPANSLRRAKAHERYEVEYRNRLFASERGWQQARYFVTHPSRQIDDFNRRGPWQHDVFEFVELAAWAEYFNGGEETPELEERIIAALWRVVDRLVEARAFDALRRAAPFRIGFAFHDAEMVVLRILDWPSLAGEDLAET
jgi:hypothetical protein